MIDIWDVLLVLGFGVVVAGLYVVHWGLAAAAGGAAIARIAYARGR